RVPDEKTSILVNILRLSGITVSENGFLKVRNQIYYRVFNKEWVLSHMPGAELRRQRAAERRGLLRATGVSLVILAIMAVLVFDARDKRNIARLTADSLKGALKETDQERQEA